MKYRYRLTIDTVFYALHSLNIALVFLIFLGGMIIAQLPALLVCFSLLAGIIMLTVTFHEDEECGEDNPEEVEV